jgi:drug/metabolite transporter (DMT)-like permease
MKRTEVTAYLKVIFSVVAWGASFIATKISLRYVSPVTVVWMRFAIGILILGAAVYLRRQLSFPCLKELGYFALVGLIGITYHQWLQSTGLVTSQATTTAWIVATTPIFIAILGWLVLKEKLGWDAVAGILLAAFGVLLVVTKGDIGSIAQGQFGAPGDLLILISAPNWAVFSVLSRRGLKRHPAAMMMFYVMTIGWMFTNLQFFTGPGLVEIRLLAVDGWLGILFLGVFCTGLAYIFWYDALHALPATRVGVFLYLEPLVTVIVARLVLAEALVPVSLMGGGVILFGVWLVNRPKSKTTE